MAERHWRTTPPMELDKATPILIVDDYRTMLRIIRNLLTQLGFEHLEEATDGSSALARLRVGRFGLVISDWNMAPMSGLELLRQMRADPALKDLPFIMVTADRRPAEAERAGVSGYLVKPFNADSLRSRIAGALAR
jgi:two-component system chemotaxis response regulator CheY